MNINIRASTYDTCLNRINHRQQCSDEPTESV